MESETGTGSSQAMVSLYRVVSSDHHEPHLRVGKPLVDYGARRHRIYKDVNPDGTSISVEAERVKPLCAECYGSHGVWRDYGHAGAHGDSAPWTPPKES